MTFPSSSISSAIQAILVNILSDSPPVSVTLHFICIVSELRFPSSYADKFVVLFDFLVRYKVLSSVLYELSSKFPLTTSTNSNPVGNWSTISVALPAFSPSLYMVILYVIVSFNFTSTGSFLCLYVAVVPFSNVLSSTTGTLLLVTGSSFTSVIYFLKLKSNSFGNFATCMIGCASAF